MADKRSNFFVLPRTIGRCGSTWLCELIDSHPQIACLNEVFNPGQSERYQPVLEHLGESRDPAMLYDGIAAFRPGMTQIGFKLFREQISDDDLGNLIAYADRIVLIDRENLTQAIASQFHAEATDKWFLREGESAPDKMTESIEIDLKKARARLEYARRTGVELSARIEAAGTPSTIISYEHLTQDTQAVMDNLFAFLGLPPSPVKSSLRKVHANTDFVTNRDEVNAEFEAEFGRL